ncbi:MAG TPA: hypothetical protein DEF78_08370 [Sphingobacterium sp.]|nr:hypothetical protein [Sphingobacterium sp.]
MSPIVFNFHFKRFIKQLSAFRRCTMRLGIRLISQIKEVLHAIKKINLVIRSPIGKMEASPNKKFFGAAVTIQLLKILIT